MGFPGLLNTLGTLLDRSQTIKQISNNRKFGCMYADTLGCTYADFGCMSMERLGAKCAVVGCIYMETVGCIYADLGCMSMERLGAKCAVVGCMYMETFGCMYAETVGCKVCGWWVQVYGAVGCLPDSR